MYVVERIVGLNLLPIWKREIRVWDSQFVPPSLDRLVALLLHRLGLMGKEDRELLRSFVKPGMTVLDVGANQGLYTVLLSRLVGPQGTVIAFEPEADMYAALLRNLETNNCTNVVAIRKAIGSGASEAVLARSLIHGGDNRLMRDEPGASSLCRNAAVEVDSIDNIVDDRAVHFVKIDVQGWEAEVLKGMRKCLDRNPDIVLVFEFWPKGLLAAGSDPASFLQGILTSGFTLQEPGQPNPLREDDIPALINRLPGWRFTNFVARLKHDLT